MAGKTIPPAGLEAPKRELPGSCQGAILSSRRLTPKREFLSLDIVGPTLFLASDAASYITGQVIVVDGGAYML